MGFFFGKYFFFRLITPLLHGRKYLELALKNFCKAIGCLCYHPESHNCCVYCDDTAAYVVCIGFKSRKVLKLL